ncbi:MAG: hypothetical protein ACI9EW_003504 [Cellvibrionaceae bacterium]|jgi:hypothetical protein
MLTIRVDGYEIDLSPFKDVLASSGISKAVIDQFSAEASLDMRLTSSIWADASFRAETASHLIMSIPKEMPVEDLPTLPDQLAILLHTELILAMDKYQVDTEEKDTAEQLLQDIMRPIVYHLIERHYAGRPNGEQTAIVCEAISQTITPNWQVVNHGKWEIRLLDSLIGPIGYEFRTADEVMYSDGSMTVSGEFFYLLAISLAQSMSTIVLT